MPSAASNSYLDDVEAAGGRDMKRRSLSQAHSLTHFRTVRGVREPGLPSRDYSERQHGRLLEQPGPRCGGSPRSAFRSGAGVEATTLESGSVAKSTRPGFARVGLAARERPCQHRVQRRAAPSRARTAGAAEGQGGKASGRHARVTRR
jgi:hypothetical protein